MNRHPDLGWKCKLIHFSGFQQFLSPDIQDLVAPADLIIFQRNLITPEAHASIQYWRGMGKPVVVDLDDAYLFLPWSNPAHKFWFERDFPVTHNEEWQKGGALKMLLEGLRLSDGLIAPNRLLLNDFKRWSRNSYYLQNYAEPEWWSNLPDRETLKKERGMEDRIIIGWGGSMSHYDSWHGSGIMQAAERVSNRHPEVLWLICGNDTRVLSQMNVSPRQKAHQGGVPPNLWPRTVASFDIGVAPLFGPYDQRRSWIKGMEYALGGVPWIGQDGETYGDIADWGTLIPESVDAWEEALEDKITHLVDEQERSRGMVQNARQAFIVDNNLDVYSRIFGQIIEDFNDKAQGLPGVFEVIPESENGKEKIKKEEEPVTA